AALGLQLVQRPPVGHVAAVHVLQRDVDLLAGRVVGGPGGVRVLHPQLLVAADEVQVVVAEHAAGQQVGLGEDLEAVADAEDGQARLRLLDDGVHDRRETGDGPGPQVVAVGEPAAQHHGVDLLEVLVLVPERHRFGAGQADRAPAVAVVETAGESDDANTSGHFTASATSSTRTVKSSITVLARKDSARSWMRASAASSTGPSTSSSNRFP